METSHTEVSGGDSYQNCHVGVVSTVTFQV